MINRRTISSMVLLCIAVCVGVLTLDLSRRAGMVPQRVVIATIAFILVKLIVDFLSGNAESNPDEEREPAHRNPLWRDVIWFAAAPISVVGLGLTVGAGVYALGFLVWRTRASSWFALVYACVAAALIYFATELLFLQFSYQGLLPKLVSAVS